MPCHAPAATLQKNIIHPAGTGYSDVFQKDMIICRVHMVHGHDTQSMSICEQPKSQRTACVKPLERGASNPRSIVICDIWPMVRDPLTAHYALPVRSTFLSVDERISCRAHTQRSYCLLVPYCKIDPRSPVRYLLLFSLRRETALTCTTGEPPRPETLRGVA